MRKLFLIIGAGMALAACQANQPASKAAAPQAAVPAPTDLACERIPNPPAGSSAVSPGSTLPSGPNLAGCGEALPPPGAATLMPAAPRGAMGAGEAMPAPGAAIIRPNR